MLLRSELEFHSIFCYLKESVLARYFSQEVQNEPLVYDTKLYNNAPRTDYKIIDPNSSFGSLAPQEGRGWVSFDLNEENKCHIYNESLDEYIPTYNTPFKDYCFALPVDREFDYIFVKDQYGNVLDRDWYSLDYQSCRVRYPVKNTPSGIVSSGITPTSIDYRFHLVSLLDGWPTDTTITQLPIVSMYPIKEKVEGFQVGPGAKSVNNYIIDIFASSTGERRQLVNIIKQSLFNKSISVLDFNRTGFPLRQNGTINTNFLTPVDVDGSNYLIYLTLNKGNGNILYFINIEVTYDSSPRSTMITSMRHMAQIKFTTHSYSDRDPELVGKFSGLEVPIGGYDSLISRSYTT